jgi:hypothetical protein
MFPLEVSLETENQSSAFQVINAANAAPLSAAVLMAQHQLLLARAGCWLAAAGRAAASLPRRRLAPSAQ